MWKLSPQQQALPAKERTVSKKKAVCLPKTKTKKSVRKEKNILNRIPHPQRTTQKRKKGENIIKDKIDVGSRRQKGLSVGWSWVFDTHRFMIRDRGLSTRLKSRWNWR